MTNHVLLLIHTSYLWYAKIAKSSCDTAATLSARVLQLSAELESFDYYSPCEVLTGVREGTALVF